MFFKAPNPVKLTQPTAPAAMPIPTPMPQQQASFSPEDLSSAPMPVPEQAESVMSPASDQRTEMPAVNPYAKPSNYTEQPESNPESENRVTVSSVDPHEEILPNGDKVKRCQFFGYLVHTRKNSLHSG